MSTKRSDIPHPLLDQLTTDFKLKNDLGLARFLGVAISTISKIRYGSAMAGARPTGTARRYRSYRLTGDMIITIHEKTGMSVAQIKALAEGNND